MSDVYSIERLASLPGPSWLTDERARAAATFADSELPHTASEEWRYSRIDDIDLSQFPLADTAPESLDGAGVVPESAASLSDIFGAHAGRLVHRNGRLVSVELDPALAERGVRFGLLSDLETAPSEWADSAGVPDAFDSLNIAGTIDPLVLSVPRGVAIELPFQVIGIVDPDAPATLLCRLNVHAGENSEFSVIDWTSSPSSSSSQPAAVLVPRTSVRLERAARVRMVSVNALAESTHQLGAVSAAIGQDATLRVAHVAIGGDFARNRFDCRLVGRGASVRLSAVYLGHEDQMHDLRVFQSHEAEDTTSDLVFKGALDDRARAVYTGMVRVDHAARGTNATQSNRIIKLSPEAWAESVPNLEIHHNDVRCSHASVVGPIDEDQRFYLESRGIAPQVAERLVISGFFEDLLDTLGIDGVSEAVRPLIAEKLGGNS